MSGARVGSLFVFALALQFSTDSLAAQNITASVGENRQEVLEPSAQITLPVLVDMTNADTLNLASLQFRLTWDTAVVSYASWSAGSFGAITANEDAVAGGTLQANLISTTGTTNSFTAMNLTFDAGTAGSTIALLEMLAAGSASGGDLLSRIVANSVSICIDVGGLVGDVTSSDLVDVIDAQQIARWLVDLAVGSSERMRSHGDVNNDGQTNVVDAQQIARWAAELPVDYSIGDAIVLNCTDALTVSTTALPTAAVGTVYSQPLSAAGADGTYSWSISAGTLPAGISLVGSTISGAPTSTGTSEFTVKATSGDGQTATRPLSIKVSPGLSVTTASLPAGIVDTTYATTLTATGGDSTFVWSITSGTLPNGLTLSADTISGTPTAAATSTFTVQVTTGDGQTATKELSIAIHGTLSITTTSLSDGMEGSVYKDTLVATGGDSTYTWSVSAGTLPAGLTLNGDTITGTPTTAATSTFTVQVTSGDAQTVTKELSITVSVQVPDSVTLSPTSLSFASLGDTATITPTVKDANDSTIVSPTVTWASSDTTAATVSAAGLVTAVANGTATITATSGSVSGTAAVTVTQGASSITVSPDSLSFASLTDTATLVATVKDANDSTIASPTVTWATSGTTVATVSSAGLVTSKGNGTATITATSGSVTKTVAVTVTQIAASVSFLGPNGNPRSSEILQSLGISYALGDGTRESRLVVKDPAGTVITNPTVTWTSDTASVASVSEAGVVTSHSNGRTTITATSGSYSATTVFRVDQLAMTITLSPDTVSLSSLSDTVTITATVKDGNDSTIAASYLSPWPQWSSLNTSVATVSSAGLVTSVADGTATIKVIAHAIDATASVTVEEVFLLAANGVTVICTAADVGQTGTLGGVTYTKRSQAQITTGNAPTTCTSDVTDMSGMFIDARSFNGDIGSWDVSSVTDMGRMFRGADGEFNQDLNSWDVSSVTDMNSMFRLTSTFNGEIGSWDVSNVTDMGFMFAFSYAFNADISSWNVSSVTDMGRMFYHAETFNRDIGSSWDVSNVTTMRSMFYNADTFNTDIGSWNVSKVTNMNHMFNNADVFNQDLSGWCVSLITSKPDGFDGDQTAWVLARPVWGTCPP